MPSSCEPFDLVLAYPQWQGSGRHENLPRGALVAAKVCAEFGPVASVPEAGEGEAAFGINRFTAIMDQFRAAQQILNEQQPRRLLTAGGDCAVDIASIDYLYGLYPDLTVIWVDAHLDANTPDTSPSGSFHGMPVAAILGSAPTDLQNRLGKPLPASQFFYVAAHVGDPGDWRFQTQKGLRWWTPDQPISGPVHIHFDLDVLDPVEFPFLAYPEGNLSLKAGLDVVQTLATNTNLVGLTITEFAPADETEAAAGSAYIRHICETACASLNKENL